MNHENWNGFKKGVWTDEINVRDFIQNNYNAYTGDSSFIRSGEIIFAFENPDLLKGYTEAEYQTILNEMRD